MIVLSKIREHFPVRRLEWACAAIIAGLGARLLDPADTFAQPSFRELAAFADEGTWGTAMLLIGGLRMIVLAYNGAWRPSPELRGLFAITCGIIFAALTFGLEAAGTASTGPVPYLVLFLCEGSNTWIAAVDARVPFNERTHKNGNTDR